MLRRLFALLPVLAALAYAAVALFAPDDFKRDLFGPCGMAVITVTVIKAKPKRLTLLAVNDGTGDAVITNATIIAAMADGPLKQLWNQARTGATQAILRSALVEDRGYLRTQSRLAVNDTTATRCDQFADVDTDAVTATKAEINIGMSKTAGAADEMYIEIGMRDPDA